MIKVAVIGCGGIARSVHMPALRDLRMQGKIELSAVCDIIPERAEAIAKEYRAACVYTNYRQLISENKPLWCCTMKSTTEEPETVEKQAKRYNTRYNIREQL